MSTQDDDEYRRKVLLRDLIALDDEHAKLLQFDKNELNGLLDEVRSVVDEKKIKRLTTKDIAEAGNLLAVYRTLYGLLSRTAHHRVRDLETNVVTDAANTIIEMRWGPKTEPGEIQDVLIIGCDILFLAVRTIVDFRQQLLDTEFSDLRRRYEGILLSGGSKLQEQVAGDK